jgi:hypothetical protein
MRRPVAVPSRIPEQEDSGLNVEEHASVLDAVVDLTKPSEQKNVEVNMWCILMKIVPE